MNPSSSMGLHRLTVAWSTVWLLAGLLHLPSSLIAAESLASQPAPPTKADLDYGQAQVRRMLKDRPTMAEHVKEGDAIWQWAVGRFAGEDLGLRVHWDPNRPRPGWYYERLFPWKDQEPLIRVNDVYAAEANAPEPMTFTDSWGYTVSALYEIAEARRYLQVYEDGVEGRISRHDYIVRNAKADYRVAERVAGFHRTVWTPWARDKGIAIAPFRISAKYCATYETWFDQFKDPDSWYPWGSWGVYYDTDLLPHLIRNGKLTASPSDLEHGAQQIRLLFHDRPGMGEHVVEGDKLWNWTVQQFAGARAGARINWRPQAPSMGNVSNHDRPYRGKPGVVRVCWCYRDGPKKNKPIPPDYLWGYLVYEFNRLAHAAEYTKAYFDAAAGIHSKQAYVDGHTRMDYQALKETKEFYEMVWKPWARGSGIEPGKFLILDRFKDNYEEWLAQFDPLQPGHPSHVWNTVWHRNIVPHLLKTGRIDPNSPDALQGEALAKSPLGVQNTDLIHGESQVRSMLGTRPALKTHVEERDAIWTWAVRRFAGEGTGMRLRWKASRPPDGQNSSHSVSFDSDMPEIRLSARWASGPNQGQPMSFEDAWGYVVFEIEAMSMLAEYAKNEEWAVMRSLTKDQYAARNTRLDHKALNRTLEFYETVWKPWAKAKGIETKGFAVLAKYDADYDAWIGAFTPGASDDPRQVWAARYEGARKRYLPQPTDTDEVSPVPYVVMGIGGFILLAFLYAEVRARSKNPPFGASAP
ncbi:MAG: hypothetical protein JXQ73_04860 [Phycisphaerae bacterium]|nr:hypothetical protein [Phycisphaerae bacterium]